MENVANNLLRAVEEEGRRQAEALKLIEEGCELIEKGKQMLRGFGVIEGGARSAAPITVAEGSYRQDVVQRMVSLFKNNGNTPLSPRDMAAALGFANKQSIYTPLNRELKKSNPRIIRSSDGLYKAAQQKLHNGTRG